MSKITVFCKNCTFSTAKLNEKSTISRHKTAITSMFSSTVSVLVEPVPRRSLYCTTWYYPEAGTAPPAPVRTSRNPERDLPQCSLPKQALGKALVIFQTPDPGIVEAGKLNYYVLGPAAG